MLFNVQLTDGTGKPLICTLCGKMDHSASAKARARRKLIMEHKSRKKKRIFQGGQPLLNSTF